MNKFSKYIFLLLLLFSANPLISEDKEINIYGTFPGNSYSVEFSLEYKVLNYDIIGIQNSTYLKYGSSVFGFQGLGVLYSFPIIGFTHFFGTDEGFEIGANYFRRRATGSYNNEKGEPHNKRNEQHIGFEIGYRNYYNDNALFRFTFTPFYNLDNPEDNFDPIRSFYLLISVSVGYSF